MGVSRQILAFFKGKIHAFISLVHLLMNSMTEKRRVSGEKAGNRAKRSQLNVGVDPEI